MASIHRLVGENAARLFASKYFIKSSAELFSAVKHPWFQFINCMTNFAEQCGWVGKIGVKNKQWYGHAH